MNGRLRDLYRTGWMWRGWRKADMRYIMYFLSFRENLSLLLERRSSAGKCALVDPMVHRERGDCHLGRKWTSSPLDSILLTLRSFLQWLYGNIFVWYGMISMSGYEAKAQPCKCFALLLKILLG